MDLETLIYNTRVNLRALGYDKSVRSGNSTDTENSTNPNSVSITGQLNVARREYQAALGLYMVEGTISFTNGDRDYSVPSTVAAVRSVYYSNKRLRSTTIEDQDARSYNWRSETGTPKLYYMIGSRTIGLIPSPSVGGGSGTIYVYGLGELTDLSALADIPTEVAPLYHDLFHIRAALNIAMGDAANDAAKSRVEPLLAREKTLLASLVKGLGVESTDNDAPLRLHGVAQGQTFDGGMPQ